MTVDLAHRTVRLWPSNESPVRRPSSRAGDDEVVEPTARTDDSDVAALTVITSTYRDVRAGIIFGDAPPPAKQQCVEWPSDLSLGDHPPTVPVTVIPDLEPAEPPQDPPTGQRRAASFWFRLVRTWGPARHGRHSPHRRSDEDRPGSTAASRDDAVRQTNGSAAQWGLVVPSRKVAGRWS
jgi:hypothetical protein